MAIVQYTCNICKRAIHKPQNVHGLETINRCTITSGCRGSLYQEQLLQDFVRGEFPEDVIGLDNYQQRKVLYNHPQPIESQEWTIKHDLGGSPVVSVFVDRPGDQPQIELIPTINIVSDDELTLQFDRPESGRAQLVARSSDPQLLQPTAAAVVEELQNYQLSSDGELSIATRTSFPAAEPTEINVEITYRTTTGIDVTTLYSVDDQPSNISPWVTHDRIIVNGKIFTVRSFNIITTNIVSGLIPNGSNVRITGVDTGSGLRALGDNEMLLLLASAPFDAVDTITDKAVDAYSVAGNDNTFSLFLNNNNLVVTCDIIFNVHPPIRSIAQ